MKQEGFKVGEQAIVRKGAEITSENGTLTIKNLTHNQTITVDDLLDRHDGHTLLVCWKQNGKWYEAKAEDCMPSDQ